MDKKTILAILLSAIVWIAWFLWFQPKEPPKPVTQQQEEVQDEQQSASQEEKPSPAQDPITVKHASALKSESTVDINTDKYQLQLTNKGAAIKKITYLDRKVDLIVQKTPYQSRNLVDFAVYFNDEELMNGSAMDEALWNYSQAGDEIKFFTNILYNGIPLQVEKIYTFNKDTYSFNVAYRITNRGSRPFSLQNGTLIFSPGDMLGPEMDFNNRYNQISSIYSIDNDFNNGHKGNGFFSKSGDLKKDAGTTNWIGISSRYFLLVMLPDGFTGTGVVYDNREHTGFRAGMYVRLKEIKPGQSTEQKFKIYLGERDKEKLGAVDPTIIDAADVSTLIEPIRYFVIWCLMGINKFIGNLGWSLVIFSILTKLVFMPLTVKSTESMKRMQMLTPKLNELKAKHKDKPEALQKEMMKLYKENKVNPMGGCLPILLQMPFFFALYSALINSFDLWQAPFVLWIKDLSMPDTVLTISGFNLNILPLIMTATTFFQQKLTTVDTGQQQKIMMMVMPFVFIFIFWNMPSGLVLYWSLQNIFQIAHQLITNKFGKKEE
ncbi:MAG TPA: membrane protein insertase YidC [Spirochaetota bacterium]|nr:membrane protein insertase YidC [Spirochaetota bacterium]HPI89551.1 membrane protein insertase YidC [Spirochaetota bacterium]HPR49015.1 membrane protein insertase YidC [Spirochaetota bacterium]